MKSLMFVLFVFIGTGVLTNSESISNGDTIIVEASDFEEASDFADIAAPKSLSRVKRQYPFQYPGASNSLFPWQNNFSFGGFPNFGGNFGNFPGSKPFQIPGTKPKEQPNTCYTKNGELGKCKEFSQCYSLLFSKPEDEIQNEGLALSLRDASGNCPASSSPNYYGQYPLLFAIGSNYQQKSKPKICCGSGKKVTKPVTPTAKPPTAPKPKTTLAPTRPTLPPQWPPRLPTHAPAATTRPTLPSQWPPRIPTHAPVATTKAPEAYNCAGFYIIGGSPVASRAYPWMVSIKDGRTNRHVCGGSLISPRSVLSAAHCVQQLGGQQVANMRVYLGTNDITHTSRCSVVKKVKNIKYHRGFTMQTLHNDIAILTLDTPVQLNSNIQTVPLGSSQVSAGTKVTVAGWGGVRFGGPTVGQLRHVSLDVISNPVCAARYRGTAPAGITQNQLCAGNTGRDSCVGDSGGPLMMNGQQVGIVSFGVNCGTQPGVYTRVANYLSWINKNKS